MQNLAYAHPYVRNVSRVGDQLKLDVEVTNFEGTEGAVEITGVATQSTGGVASLSEFKDIADAFPGEGDDKDESFVTVTANILPPNPWRDDLEVTIFVRVSKVWVTVLGTLPHGEASTAPPAWGGRPKAVTHFDGKTRAPQAA